MSDNEHYEYATAAFSAANATSPSEFNAECREDAAIQASLAIAYEQRTANLLALWSNPQSRQEDINGNPMTYSINSDMPGKLIEEIIQRLGIKP